MRLLVSMIALLLSLSASGQQGKGYVFDSVYIGSSFTEVAEALCNRYGEPTTKDDHQIVYHHKSFQQYEFDVLNFFFHQGKLSEVRLYTQQPSFAKAQQDMEKIAKIIDATWPLSKDREGRYTWFYVGGIAPSGIGHLLTLHTYPSGKGQRTELRFGPFNK